MKEALCTRYKIADDYEEGIFTSDNLFFNRSRVRIFPKNAEILPERAIWGGWEGRWYTIEMFVPDLDDSKREKALARIAEIERELQELKKEV